VQPYIMLMNKPWQGTYKLPSIFKTREVVSSTVPFASPVLRKNFCDSTLLLTFTITKTKSRTMVVYKHNVMLM
jgi:hypothetical protein